MVSIIEFRALTINQSTNQFERENWNLTSSTEKWEQTEIYLKKIEEKSRFYRFLNVFALDRENNLNFHSQNLFLGWTLSTLSYLSR